MDNNARDIMEFCVKVLDAKKGLDIQVLKVEDLTVLTEYMVFCTGVSSTQIKTLADELEYKLKEKGIPPYKTEGFDTASWIILDYSSVMVHIFNNKSRDFYKLERLWADGQKIDISDILTKE